MFSKNEKEWIEKYRDFLDKASMKEILDSDIIFGDKTLEADEMSRLLFYINYIHPQPLKWAILVHPRAGEYYPVDLCLFVPGDGFTSCGFDNADVKSSSDTVAIRDNLIRVISYQVKEEIARKVIEKANISWR